MTRSSWLLAITLTLTLGSAGWAQEAQEGLPAQLKNLPAEEFVSAGEEVIKQANAATQTAIRYEASRVLSFYDPLQVPTSEYPLLYRLHRLAGGGIEPAVHKRLHDAMNSRQDNWADKPYEDIRGKIALMARLKLQFKAFAEAQNWIAAGGTLNKIEASSQGLEDLKNPLAPVAMKVLFANAKMVHGNFSVAWEGRLVPPQTGSYTFFISPLNVSASHRKRGTGSQAWSFARSMDREPYEWRRRLAWPGVLTRENASLRRGALMRRICPSEGHFANYASPASERVDLSQGNAAFATINSLVGGRALETRIRVWG